jgi:hypothetical protein
MVAQGSEGPLGDQTDLKHYTHQECTQGAHTSHCAKDGGKRAHEGFGRTDLVSVHPGLPRGAQ